MNERSWKLSVVEGVLTLELSTDGTNVTTIAATYEDSDIEPNTWTNVAAVRSGDTVRLYIDNEPVTDAVTFTGGQNAPSRLGSNDIPHCI